MNYAICRLLECAAIGAANSPQLESTLLILIQKLLATAAANDASVVAALFTSRALSLDALGGSPFLHGSTVSKVQAVKKLPPSLPLQAYAATTLGVMLAGHLLLRRKSRISVSDHHALLNFITRSEPVLQSPSALYAVDVLATCCHETHRHLRQMQLQGGYGATATAPGSSSASGSVSTGTSSSASCGSASLTSSSHNSASSKNAESLQIMVSNLQIVLDKLSKTVLTRARCDFLLL